MSKWDQQLTALVFLLQLMQLLEVIIYRLDRVGADQPLPTTNRTLTHTFYIQMRLVLDLLGQIDELFLVNNEKVVIGEILVDRVRLERRVANLDAYFDLLPAHEYRVGLANVPQTPEQDLFKRVN